MKIIRSGIDRKEVIDFYIKTDNHKKGTTTLPDYASLNWDDPNQLDEWLHQHD